MNDQTPMTNDEFGTVGALPNVESAKQSQDQMRQADGILAIGAWTLGICHSLVIGHWSLVIGHFTSSHFQLS
jgi:hypothetical protein